jgi:Heparinase II/III-like protein/Heparinase II/III N-terminus
VNVILTALPPAPSFDANFTPRLPLPPGVAGIECAQQIVDLADQIQRHRFPILARTIDAGPDIHWRRDHLRGIETGLTYFRRIPYLDTPRAGDHKVIWELNRHEHLIVLAQAYLLTGDRRHLDEIRAQLESWIAGNPFHRGTNWASALEVGFRALSWIWVDHLVGGELPGEFRAGWLHMLYLHGCHLANNLSFYFSPNNHLVGEALALHALGIFFAGVPKAARWEQLGARVMREQMDRQIRADGSSFEQSTYYQVYLLDMFRLHAVLATPGPEYLAKLERMAEYTHAVIGPSRLPPMLGDDDGGRLPLGSIRWPARAEKWESRLFRDAGIAVMICGATHAIVDAGPFGVLHSGHSHSDTLSIVVRSGDEEILIDPGTYTYTGEPKWRDWFRGSSAHNTIRIDRRNQAVMAGPFKWTGQPDVAILDWRTNSTCDILEAECRYAGFTHRRRVEFQKPDVFLIADIVSGPLGEHEIEQFWHLGSLAARRHLILPADAELTESWRSTTFGEKHPSPMLRVHRRCTLPLLLEARIELGTAPSRSRFSHARPPTPDATEPRA